jgi:hypothetical protein
MAETLDLERDEFLMLLTEALRAGPGSPAWHQAVLRLRDMGQEGDEYQMLMAAREHLESGKDYRSVRAGPNFTRKVLMEIEKDGGGGRQSGRLSTANMITVAAALAGLAVVVVVGYFLLHGGAAPGHGAADELAGQVFTTTRLESTFAGALPPSWRAIGALALDSSDGLRLKPARGDDTAHLGGGIVMTSDLAPDEVFAVDVTLRAGTPAEGMATQVFVTDEPQFSDDKGTSPHELVCLLQDGQVSVVLPNGRVAGRGQTYHGRATVSVRIAVNRDGAVVSAGDQRLYAGANQLAANKPRYVGVRFLRRGEARPHSAPSIIQSVRLLKP